VSQAPDLSVVIPVYNEELNLDALCREVTEVLSGWGRSYEIVLIDDGSHDGSFDALRRIQAADARIRVIQFRRNFGQTAAFAAGFAAARGRLIVTSDGDLQNDPRDIPAMVDRLEGEELDIVCGWRRDRKDTFINRRLPSTVANALISWATGVKLNDYGCSLKVFRAEVVKPLRLYGELHRFLPALASEMGVRIAEQPVRHRARVHGRSKYGISRTIRVILDLITVKFLLSYSTRPLQMFGLIGMPMSAVGLATIGWLAWLRLQASITGNWDGYQPIADRPLFMIAILLVFTGVQLVTLGLLAEMQARTYHESQSKPVYVVRQVLEAPAPAEPPDQPGRVP
jgi:glycosyltransferase involved in cell wall biosynthesis